MITFTGKEPWLSIPVEKLEWGDLPSEFEARSKAICVLALRQYQYDAYLRTEHWHSVRESALKRFRGQCICGKNAVDVHHLNYDRKGFEHPEDVVALCRSCHKIWHETWTLQARESLELTA